jgi:hypothetical protein
MGIHWRTVSKHEVDFVFEAAGRVKVGPASALPVCHLSTHRSLEHLVAD